MSKPQAKATEGTTRRFAGLRDRWEGRAAEYGDAPTGVLFRGLSEALNRHLHRFHVSRVCSRLLPLLPQGAVILDLGCGYGRIGAEIRAQRPDLHLVGADFSLLYCNLYRRHASDEVVCCDLGALPFRSGVFDAIIAVTTLMYLPPEKRVELSNAVLSLLKPGGVAQLIEPGQELIDLLARLRPQSAAQTTGGLGFELGEFRALGGADYQLLGIGGMPAFTPALPVLMAVESFPALQRNLLRVVETLDSKLERFSRWSLHRWLLLRRLR